MTRAMSGCELAVILVTAPKGEGGRIARIVLESKQAACVNITSVRSMYWWKGKLEESDEDLLIIKTRRDTADKLVEKIREVHPYEVPEIIVFSPEKVHEAYLDWACMSVEA